MSCDCELRQRAWNPNTRRCETCGQLFVDRRTEVSVPASALPPSTWDLVIAHVERLRKTFDASDAVLINVLDDLDAIEGLGAGPDHRDNLYAGYRQMLDGSLYLMRELHTHGLDTATVVTDVSVPDVKFRWYLRDVQQLCSGMVRTAIALRTMIDERPRIPVTEEVSAP